MPVKNGKIRQSIDNVDYDINIKTSAEQVTYDTDLSVKEKLIQITQSLNNLSTGSDSVDAKIKKSCDALFSKIMGATDQSELNAAYDTLKEVSDYVASHGTTVNDILDDINDIKGQLLSLNEKATHENIETLNKLSTSDNGKLLFNGIEITGGDSGSGGGDSSWGSISGNLEDQTDLKAALDKKANIEDIANNLTDELKRKYDDAADKAHSHSNIETLNKLSTDIDGNLAFNGESIKGDTFENKATLDKLSTGSDGNLLFNNVSIKGDTFENKATLDKLSTGSDGKLAFNGESIKEFEPIKITQSEYDGLDSTAKAKGLYFITG